MHLSSSVHYLMLYLCIHIPFLIVQNDITSRLTKAEELFLAERASFLIRKQNYANVRSPF